MNYPILIHKEKYSHYGVTVPDLPGCFSAGRTIDEAIEMAQEAIELHLEGLRVEGQAAARPGTIERYQKDPQYRGGIWAIASVKAPPTAKAGQAAASTRRAAYPVSVGGRTAKRSQERLDDIDELARGFAFVADITGLRILKMLSSGPKNVTDLCEALGMRQPTVSHHLRLLRMGRLVVGTRNGKLIVYTAVAASLKELVNSIDKIALRRLLLLSR
jgi:predicted RNase H-like HicB family nuclease/DNA-binding transcriptional ArsR family regulator